MINYLELLVETIGSIIWPIVVFSIFFIFRKDIKSLISRLKSAEIKDFKIELESKIEDITKDAINYGVTIAYPLETLENQFNPDHDLPKTYVIIETWKEIEALIKNLDDRHGFHNTHNTIKYLLDNNKIPKYLANLILELRKLRNLAAHESELSISKEDYLNWISISKSVIERLK